MHEKKMAYPNAMEKHGNCWRIKKRTGWIWAVVPVDLAALSDKAERVNITLPSRVLRRIDSDAKASGETRSGFIARKALAA